EEMRPHASCGPRCMVMAWILQEFGIQSREIGLFSSHYPEYIVGHQQLEVLNSDTHHWEVYDPTWNVHFEDSETGERLSATQMCFRDVRPEAAGLPPTIAGVTPIDVYGASGWDGAYPLQTEKIVPIANLAEFGGVIYYCYQTQKANQIVINADRFD